MNKIKKEHDPLPGGEDKSKEAGGLPPVIRRRWTAANGVTLLRIAGTVALIFLPPLTPLFFWIYTLTGLTDVLDGWLARRTGTASEFGAKLDSIADLLFCTVMLVRLFPVLRQTLPVQIWYVAAGILFIRLGAYCAAAIRYRRFASMHTWLNKLTGTAVFLLPYVFAVSSGIAYGWAVCVLACVASVEELAIHLCRKNYCADQRSIFQKKTEQD